MTFTEGKQEIINNTDKAELLKIHELLKKHGVSYVSQGCLPPSRYILNFDFKKMKWECDFNEGYYSNRNERIRDKDEALDDDYNPDNRSKVITQGPIPVYAVEKFARKIFFLKDFTKTIYDLNDFKIDIQVWDASGSHASVLGKEFSWTPAEIGGLADDDDTDNVYGITLISTNEAFRKREEPYAAPWKKRLLALKALHDAGCKTWVSVEPFPTPNILKQDLGELLNEIGFVDRIIFGRMHYNSNVSKYPDYKQFYNKKASEVIEFCEKWGIDYHIKSGTIT